MFEPSLKFAYLNVIGMPPVDRMMELSQRPTLENSRENESINNSDVIGFHFRQGSYTLLVEPMMT